MTRYKAHAAVALLYLLEGRWLQVAALLSLSAFLTGCSFLTGAAAGPGEEALMTGVATGAAAIDWMLSNNVLPDDMAADLGKWFGQVNEGLAVAQQGITEVRENSVTVEQAQYGAGGAVAGVLGLIRAWRGGASKGPLKGLVGGLKAMVSKATATPPTT